MIKNYRLDKDGSLLLEPSSPALPSFDQGGKSFPCTALQFCRFGIGRVASWI